MRERRRRAWAALVAALASNAEEIAIYSALALIAVGCWSAWRPGSYLIPGAVMLWMYLPQRSSFIVPTPEKRESRAR